MRTLTPAERRAFRAKAHHLHPFVSIGQHGLTPAVLHEIAVALAAHELIKIRVFNDDRGEREALLARICEALDAAPVQHLGKILTVWRPAPEAAAPAERPRKPARARPAAPGRSEPKGEDRRRRAPSAVARGKPPAAPPQGAVARRRKPPRAGTPAALADESRARRRRATQSPAAPRGSARRGADAAPRAAGPGARRRRTPR
jgi:putative YhbY family RNA-binding protein